ncbi:hypothetical protein [Neomoorella thermoacetica]|uniref:hypothetical protein n=1 Tax=Neomoorella thermoacetica TaxID=1525 RepID=UPI0008FA0245|nr:hypothetical protein [Moorella thermoacetica]OIQ10575.1 hypothetical protein MOOTH_25450 [Moorella thermoacetica]
MRLEDLCQERRIDTIKWKTPLLVPSFSSRGFPDLREMHQKLGEHTTDASLVSAYDIYYSHLDESAIYCSEILFVDSGAFEVGNNDDLTDFYNFNGHPTKEWSKEQFEEVVKRLQPLCSLVVVSYDTRASLPEQIRNAQTFFAKIPREYAKDFLIKPIDDKMKFVDIKALINYCEELSEFDIIGFTEKELGSSFLTRCQNLVKLRQALYDRKINVPIHIFGCLDPLSVIVYFLCGADIFDSLSWLRLAYHNGIALYYNSYALIEGQWAQSYHSVYVQGSLKNLEYLARTQAIMGRFARSHDWSVLDLDPLYLKQLQALIGAAGVEF